MDYGTGGRVELIEVSYQGGAGPEATLDGVQLTHRPMSDVLRDLDAAGRHGRQSDIGFDFPDGFAIWSMSSVHISQVDPTASPDDERLIVEGVSVGAPGYFGFPSRR